MLVGETISITNLSHHSQRSASRHLAEIRCAYRGAAAKGITDSQQATGRLAGDALTLARRFREHEP